MADFARIVAAVDQVRGTDSLTRYLDQRGALAETVVDGDQFATEVRALIDANGAWEGASGDLLTALTTTGERRPKPWPATARAASSALSRVAPALRQLGYTIDHTDREAGTGRRLWKLATTPGPDGARETPSRPSQPSQHASDQQQRCDGPTWPTVTPIPTTVTPGAAVTVDAPAVTIAPGQPSHPDTTPDQAKHSGRDGCDGRDGVPRPLSDLPGCPCGAATHRARDLGTCTDCGTPHPPIQHQRPSLCPTCLPGKAATA